MPSDVWTDAFWENSPQKRKALEAIYAASHLGCWHRALGDGLASDLELILERQRDSQFQLSYGPWQMQIDPFANEVLGHYNPDRRGQIEIPKDYARERLALPIWRLLRGAMLLHASAICNDAGTIIFCAPPACGKSTLAAAMMSHPNAGYKLLSDDTLAIVIDDQNQAHALPSSTHFAMRHERFNGKTPFLEPENLGFKQILRLRPKYIADKPQKLRAIVILEHKSQDKQCYSGFQALSSLEATRSILSQQFSLSQASTSFKRLQFANASALTINCPSYSYGIDLSQTETLQKHLKECLAFFG